MLYFDLSRFQRLVEFTGIEPFVTVHSHEKGNSYEPSSRFTFLNCFPFYYQYNGDWFGDFHCVPLTLDDSESGGNFPGNLCATAKTLNAMLQFLLSRYPLD